MPAKPSQRAGKNDFRASFTVVELLWNEKLAKCKVFIGNALHTFIRNLIQVRAIGILEVNDESERLVLCE